MFYKIMGAALQKDGKLYPIGTIAEFEEDYAKTIPHRLFPVNKTDEVETEIQKLNLTLQERCKYLEEENVKLKYAKENLGKECEKFAKIVNDQATTIKAFQTQIGKTVKRGRPKGSTTKDVKNK